MKAVFQPFDPVPELMDELVDALYLLDQCRRRGVHDVDRLLEYIEYKMDEIERQRLGMSKELFVSFLAAEEVDGVVA